MFFPSSAARRKRSTSPCAHAAFFGCGTVCGFGAWNAHQFFASSLLYFFTTFAVPSRGSGAPIFTQVSKSAITAAGSLPPLLSGGIAKSLFV